MAQPLSSLFRSPLLFPRLTRWLLGFLVLIAAIQCVVIIRLQQGFLEHTFQVLNAELAESLAQQMKPYVHDRSLEIASLGTLLEQFQQHGPMHGYYLVDGKGEILLSSAERVRLQRQIVSLDPIRRFISAEHGRSLPMYNVDPLDAERVVTFSAATLRGGDDPLYFYITLQSSRMDLLYSALIDREGPLLAAVSFSATVAFAAAASLLFSIFFVRRLDRLRNTLERFSAGDATVRNSDNGQDELAFLSSSFNSMAGTISAQMEEIRAQEESRRTLVQNICHDLRTPLTSARGYVETLEMRDDRLKPEERKQFLAVVDQNLRFMQQMAEELFDLSSLEASDRPLDQRPLDVAAMAAEVVEKLQHDAERAGVALQLASATTPCTVKADPALLLRVITNLVQNAIRYTPKGGSVTVSTIGDGVAARLAVRDTGIGISQADLQRLGERFYRTDRARLMCAKGSGLGLAIVRRVLELHHSQLEIQSEEGRGSEFAFTLPQSGPARD